MGFNVSYDLETKYGDHVIMEEYNEQYSIIAARKGKDGAIWKEWVFPQDGDRKPRDKAIPLKVFLGGHAQAIKVLEYMLAELRNDSQQATTPRDEDDNSQIPF